jgi:hypothetical protein
LVTVEISACPIKSLMIMRSVATRIAANLLACIFIHPHHESVPERLVAPPAAPPMLRVSLSCTQRVLARAEALHGPSWSLCIYVRSKLYLQFLSSVWQSGECLIPGLPPTGSHIIVRFFKHLPQRQLYNGFGNGLK